MILNSLLCQKKLNLANLLYLFEQKYKIFSTFVQRITFGLVLDYLSNDTKIVIFGSILTFKLAITIEYWVCGRSIKHGRQGERSPAQAIKQQWGERWTKLGARVCYLVRRCDKERETRVRPRKVAGRPTSTHPQGHVMNILTHPQRLAVSPTRKSLLSTNYETANLHWKVTAVRG